MTDVRAQVAELYIRVALATEGAGEQPPGTNAGPYVERVQLAGGLKKGDPWCLAQAMDWGQRALPDHPAIELLLEGLRWSVPKMGGCQVFYEWALAKHLIFDTPARGDIGLIWHADMKPAARFAHALLVLEPATALTIGGNTTWPKDKGASDPKLAREGWCVARKPWPFTPKDRFVRWVNLLQAGNP